MICQLTVQLVNPCVQGALQQLQLRLTSDPVSLRYNATCDCLPKLPASALRSLMTVIAMNLFCHCFLAVESCCWSD